MTVTLYLLFIYILDFVLEHLAVKATCSRPGCDILRNPWDDSNFLFGIRPKRETEMAIRENSAHPIARG